MVSVSPAMRSWRLTKRTSTSWASGGGEASRVRNATACPAPAWRAAELRSTNRFPVARRCGPRTCRRGTSTILRGVVDDVALDHQDRHALVLLGRGGEPSKCEAAQIHRQADPGVERRGLRHGAHEIAAPADDNGIDDDQRQNARLQSRQRPPPAGTALGGALASRRNSLDVLMRLVAALRRVPLRSRLGGQPVVEIDRRNRRRIHLGVCARPRQASATLSTASARRSPERRRGGGIEAADRPAAARGCRQSAAGSAGADAWLDRVRGTTASTTRRTGASARGRGHQLVRVGRLRVPDRAAAHAAHLAPVRPQACQRRHHRM